VDLESSKIGSLGSLAKSEIKRLPDSGYTRKINWNQ